MPPRGVHSWNQSDLTREAAVYPCAVPGRLMHISIRPDSLIRYFSRPCLNDQKTVTICNSWQLKPPYNITDRTTFGAWTQELLLLTSPRTRETLEMSADWSPPATATSHVTLVRSDGKGRTRLTEAR